jgi:hypothetical protein
MSLASRDELRVELDTYEREKDRLVSEAEGKYALVQGDKVIETFDTYEDALKEGYRIFGLEKRFMVRLIQGKDRHYFFARDLPPCPS